MPPDPGPAPRSFPRRLGFRFVAVYVLLYTFPFPLDHLPIVGGRLEAAVASGWKALATRAAPLLGIERELYLGPTGSGDTTVEYLRWLLIAVLAAAGALGWALADRRSARGLAPWLEVGVRYYLGATMLTYGIVKVIPAQFPPPSLTRLLQSYGDSSPMGLVWTFMGASAAYTIFSGLGEAVGGLLLFARRTRALGAAVVAVVMTHVLVLNLSYDVPVKLFSAHLLAMALGLLALDRRRLAAAFLSERAIPAARRRPLFASRRARAIATAAALLFVGTAIYRNGSMALETYHRYGAGREKPPLWGIWEVESFLVDGAERPPLVDDPLRWRALVLDRYLPVTFDGQEFPGSAAIRQMDGAITRYAVEHDPDGAAFVFLERRRGGGAPGENESLGTLTYERPAPDRLVLSGTWQGSPTVIEARRRDLAGMELTGRGFHWVNELPYNR